MKRAPINVFSLTFLDLFSCTLGGVIILMLIFVSMLGGTRSERRRFIFTARIEVSPGARKNTRSDLLFRTKFDPKEWVEVFLVDPNGFEKKLEQSLDGDGAYVTHTSPKPAFGTWELRLRPRDRLLEATEEKAAMSFDVPTEAQRWLDHFERTLEDAYDPFLLADSVDKLLDEPLGLDTPFQLWAILVNLELLGPWCTETSSPDDPIATMLAEHAREWIGKLATRSSVDEFPARPEESILFTYKLKGHQGNDFEELASTLFDRLGRMAVRQGSLDEFPEAETALVLVGHHFARCGLPEDVSRIDGRIRSLAGECRLASRLQTWETSLHWPFAHRLRWLIAGLPVTLATFEGPVGLRYVERKGHFVDSETGEILDPESLDLALPWSPTPLQILLALARTESTEARAAGLMVPIYLATSHDKLAARFDGHLDALEKQNKEGKGEKVPTLIPAFFALDHFSSEARYERVKQVLIPDEKTHARQLVSIARELPGIFLRARKDAIQSQETTVHLLDGLIHWGSSMRSIPPERVKGLSSLASNAPVLRFGVYPDEIIVGNGVEK